MSDVYVNSAWTTEAKFNSWKASHPAFSGLVWGETAFNDIQQGIDSVNLSSGGTVHLAGEFTLSSSLNYCSNLTITSMDANAPAKLTLTGTGDSSQNIVGTSDSYLQNITFDNLNIDSTSTVFKYGVFNVAWVDGFTVSNCRIDNQSTTSTIHTSTDQNNGSGNTQNLTFTGNTVIGSDLTGENPEASCGVLYLYYVAENVQISGNKIIGVNGEQAVRVIGSAGAAVVIADNTLANTMSHGVYVSGSTASIDITGNALNNCGSYYITESPNPSYPPDAYWSAGIVISMSENGIYNISGNTITAAADGDYGIVGIKVGGSALPAGATLTVDGNAITGQMVGFKQGSGETEGLDLSAFTNYVSGNETDYSNSNVLHGENPEVVSSVANLLVNAAWTDYETGTVVVVDGQYYTIGTNAFASSAEAFSAVADATQTINLQQSAAEVLSTDLYVTVTHDLNLKADSAVTLSYSSVANDLDVVFQSEALEQKAQFQIDKNVSIVSDRVVYLGYYYAPDFLIDGSISGKQIWIGALSSQDAKVTVSETGFLDSRSEAFLTRYGATLTVNGGALVGEDQSSRKLQVNANYFVFHSGDITFNNTYVKSGQISLLTGTDQGSYTGSLILNNTILVSSGWLKNKASAVSESLTSVVSLTNSSRATFTTGTNYGEIKLDGTSSLTFTGAFANNGTFTVDASGFTSGTRKVVDVAAFSGNTVAVIGLGEGISSFVNSEGDVFLTDQKQDVLYVNSMYTPDDADGHLFGFNAFASVQTAADAVSASPLPVQTISLADSVYGVTEFQKSVKIAGTATFDTAESESLKFFTDGVNSAEYEIAAGALLTAPSISLRAENSEGANVDGLTVTVICGGSVNVTGAENDADRQIWVRRNTELTIAETGSISGVTQISNRGVINVNGELLVDTISGNGSVSLAGLSGTAGKMNISGGTLRVNGSRPISGQAAIMIASGVAGTVELSNGGKIEAVDSDMVIGEDGELILRDGSTVTLSGLSSDGNITLSSGSSLSIGSLDGAGAITLSHDSMLQVDSFDEFATVNVDLSNYTSGRYRLISWGGDGLLMGNVSVEPGEGIDYSLCFTAHGVYVYDKASPILHVNSIYADEKTAFDAGYIPEVEAFSDIASAMSKVSSGATAIRIASNTGVSSGKYFANDTTLTLELEPEVSSVTLAGDFFGGWDNLIGTPGVSNLTVKDGNYTGVIYGGGRNSSSTGMNITVTGNTRATRVYGGGLYEISGTYVEGDIHSTIGKDVTLTSRYASGKINAGKVTTGDVVVDFHGTTSWLIGGGQVWYSGSELTHKSVTVNFDGSVKKIGSEVVKINGAGVAAGAILRITDGVQVNINGGTVSGDCIFAGGLAQDANGVAGHIYITKSADRAYAAELNISNNAYITAEVAGGVHTWSAGGKITNTAEISGGTHVSISGGATVLEKVTGGNYNAFGGSTILDKATVEIANATARDVYGGSQNVGGASSAAGSTLATVGDTVVTIGNGAHILGQVAGGGYVNWVVGTGISQVTGTSLVTIDGGTVDGDVIGGGVAFSSLQNSASSTVKVIDNNTEVTLLGGSIGGNVYGGAYASNIACPDSAAVGMVTGNATVNVDGPIAVTGNIYGGGFNTEVAGLVTVNVSENAALAENTVYGGGYAADGGSASVADVVMNLNGAVGTVYGGGSADSSESASMADSVSINVGNARIGAIYGTGANSIVTGDLQISVTGNVAVTTCISARAFGTVGGTASLYIASAAALNFGTDISGFDIVNNAGSMNLAGAAHTIDAVQFTNTGSVVMDKDSLISYGGTFSNAGTITVDMAGTVAGGAYKLIDNIGSTVVTDYGTVLLTNNLNNHTAIVCNNDLYAVNTSDVYVDAAISGKAVGDTVQINGKTYIVGLTAFSTVAEGVTAVEDGGTVTIASGTYSENALQISKDITVLGQGNTVIDSAVRLSASGITMENITFNYTGITVLGEAFCVYLDGGVDFVKINNCTFVDTGFDATQTPPWGTHKGIVTNTNGNHNLTFTNNTFQGFESAIYVNPNNSNVTISGNTLENCKYGFRIAGGADITLGGNVVSNSGGYEIRNDWSGNPGTGIVITDGEFIGSPAQNWIGWIDNQNNTALDISKLTFNGKTFAMMNIEEQAAALNTIIAGKGSLNYGVSLNYAVGTDRILVDSAYINGVTFVDSGKLYEVGKQAFSAIGAATQSATQDTASIDILGGSYTGSEYFNGFKAQINGGTFDGTLFAGKNSEVVSGDAEINLNGGVFNSGAVFDGSKELVDGVSSLNVNVSELAAGVTNFDSVNVMTDVTATGVWSDNGVSIGAGKTLVVNHQNNAALVWNNTVSYGENAKLSINTPGDLSISSAVVLTGSTVGGNLSVSDNLSLVGGSVAGNLNASSGALVVSDATSIGGNISGFTSVTINSALTLGTGMGLTMTAGDDQLFVNSALTLDAIDFGAGNDSITLANGASIVLNGNTFQFTGTLSVGGSGTIYALNMTTESLAAIQILDGSSVQIVTGNGTLPAGEVVVVTPETSGTDIVITADQGGAQVTGGVSNEQGSIILNSAGATPDDSLNVAGSLLASGDVTINNGASNTVIHGDVRTGNSLNIANDTAGVLEVSGDITASNGTISNNDLSSDLGRLVIGGLLTIDNSLSIVNRHENSITGLNGSGAQISAANVTIQNDGHLNLNLVSSGKITVSGNTSANTLTGSMDAAIIDVTNDNTGAVRDWGATASSSIKIVNNGQIENSTFDSDIINLSGDGSYENIKVIYNGTAPLATNASRFVFDAASELGTDIKADNTGARTDATIGVNLVAGSKMELYTGIFDGQLSGTNVANFDLLGSARANADTFNGSLQNMGSLKISQTNLSLLGAEYDVTGIALDDATLNWDWTSGNDPFSGTSRIAVSGTSTDIVNFRQNGVYNMDDLDVSGFLGAAQVATGSTLLMDDATEYFDRIELAGGAAVFGVAGQSAVLSGSGSARLNANTLLDLSGFTGGIDMASGVTLDTDVNGDSVNDLVGGVFANDGEMHSLSGDLALNLNNVTHTGSRRVYAGGVASNNSVVRVAGNVNLTVADNVSTDKTSNLYGAGYVSGGAALRIERDVTVSVTGDSTYGSVFGGGRIQDGASSLLQIGGSVNVSISAGTFEGFVGNGTQALSGISTINGGTSLTISGGTFNSFVYGGGYSQGGASTINGNCSISISGGTFNQTVYGGSLAGTAAASGNNMIAGNISMTIDSSTNAVSFGDHIYAGSYGIGAVNGNTQILFTGVGSNLTFATSGTVCGESQLIESGRNVTGSKTLAFDNFTGAFNADIAAFSDFKVMGNSTVTLSKGSSSASALANINNWDLELAAGSDALLVWDEGNNNFAGDSMQLTFDSASFSSKTIIDANDLNVMNGWDQLGSVSMVIDNVNYSAAFTENKWLCSVDDAHKWALSVDENNKNLVLSNIA